tara:strand:- start:1839 stop:2897 length:1059 start_codon:yes stop_codon:yes gene_type:complete
LRVLVSNVTSYKAVVIINFLKKSYKDIFIVGIDSILLSKIFHISSINRYYYVKFDKNYIQSIKDLIIKNRIDIFLPTHSSEMTMVLENKLKLNKTLDYYSNIDKFNKINDKDSLSTLCKQLNIPTPKKFSKLSVANGPCVVKPKVSAGSKGVYYLKNKNDYEQFFKKNKNCKNSIIQQYVRGAGAGYSLFSSKGKIIIGHGHIRLAEYPVSGGSSVYRKSFNDDRMIDISKKIISHLQWSGFAMIEFKIANNGDLYLIEINPRIWGSINQGLINGINYFSCILGKADNIKRTNINYRTYLSPLIYLSFFYYLINLNFKPIIHFLKSIKKNKADVNFFTQIRAWISILLRYLT